MGSWGVRLTWFDCKSPRSLSVHILINHMFACKNYVYTRNRAPPTHTRYWGKDLTFYWLTDKITHLGSWENTRAKKLANSVLQYVA